MGEVYLARDTRLRRKVALKLLPSHLTAAEERVQRLQHEAYAASALNHPNILTIYEVGQADELTTSLQSMWRESRCGRGWGAVRWALANSSMWERRSLQRW